MAVDIEKLTQLTKAEGDLQKSLKDLADIKFALDESSIVAITDQTGIIKDVNDKFCEISKYSRDELLGDHVICMEDPQDACAVAASIVALTEGALPKLDALPGVLAGEDRPEPRRTRSFFGGLLARQGSDGTPRAA